jgi:hypothetical protein
MTLARVLVLAVASAGCSSPDAPVMGDAASTGDSAPDVDGVPDAPWTMGHVRIRVLSRLMTSESFLFSNPDGSIAAFIPADADRAAEADVAEGGSVTWIPTTGPGNYAFSTVRGVKNGDDILLDYVWQDDLGEATVSFPPAPGFKTDELITYVAAAFCSLGGGPVPGSTAAPSVKVRAIAGCDAALPAVRVWASGLAPDGNPKRMVLEQAVTQTSLMSGDSITLSGTWSEPVSRHAAFSNFPTGATNMGYGRSSSPSGALAAGDPLTFTSSMGSLDCQFMTNDSDDHAVYYYSAGFGDSTGMVNYEVRANSDSSFSVDVASSLLPRVRLGTLEQDASVSYPVMIDEADMIFSKVEYQTPSKFVEWELFGPPSAFRLPRLPPELMATPFTTSEDVAYPVRITAYESSFQDYDDLRQAPVRLRFPSPLGPLTPVGARLRVSSAERP